MSKITDIIKESVSVKNKVLEDSRLLDTIEKTIAVTVAALRNGNRLYFCGNGGSAADAQHLAAEFS